MTTAPSLKASLADLRFFAAANLATVARMLPMTAPSFWTTTRTMGHPSTLETADGLAGRGGLSGWQKNRATALLVANLSSPAALKDIATHCGISVGHFTRAFRNSTGYSPHQWLILYRIELAKNLLLETSGSLIAIAVECGFADQSHFTRMFTRHVGETPGRWRRTWAAKMADGEPETA